MTTSVTVQETTVSVELVENVVSVSTPQTKNVYVGLSGVQGPLPKYEQYIHTLTAQNITEKKVYLDYPADENGFIFFQPLSAPHVGRNTDYAFIKSENAITWNGLGLEGFLEESEQVEIVYRRYLYN